MIEEVFITNFPPFDNKNYFFHPLVQSGLVTINGERVEAAQEDLRSCLHGRQAQAHEYDH